MGCGGRCEELAHPSFAGPGLRFDRYSCSDQLICIGHQDDAIAHHNPHKTDAPHNVRNPIGLPVMINPSIASQQAQ